MKKAASIGDKKNLIQGKEEFTSHILQLQEVVNVETLRTGGSGSETFDTDFPEFAAGVTCSLWSVFLQPIRAFLFCPAATGGALDETFRVEETLETRCARNIGAELTEPEKVG